MKRQLVMLALSGFAVSLPNCLYAQSARTAYQSQILNNAIGRTNSAYSLPQPHSAAKTTVSASRLIKIISWVGSSSASPNRDSVLFDYSGGRGGYYKLGYYSLFDGREVKYDNNHVYLYDGTAGTYRPSNKFTQVFDVNSNVTLRTQKEWDASTAAWHDVALQQYTYDGANRMLTYIDQGENLSTGMLMNTYKATYSYAGSNLASGVSQQWNQVSGAWENYSKVTYAYDGSNNVIGSEFKMWDTLTAAWKDYGREINTYNGANNIVAKLQQAWNDTAGLWYNATREIYTWDAANNKISDSFQSWEPATSTWVTYAIITFSGFTAHQPGMQIAQVRDTATSAFVNVMKNTYAYNIFNQVTSFDQQTWNTTTGAWQQQVGENFYYESYVSAVEPLANTNGKAAVYPVPASGSITVDVQWNEPQEFNLSIIDMNGRTLDTRSIAACSQYAEKLSIGELPAGNYIINMVGANGKIVQRITVAR